jgi:hypothetical protein
LEFLLLVLCKLSQKDLDVEGPSLWKILFCGSAGCVC